MTSVTENCQYIRAAIPHNAITIKPANSFAVAHLQANMKISAIVICSGLAVASCEVQYQHPEEWQLWKTEHGKNYESQREELERHLVWVSNREYINAHNKNAHIFGFTLAMNHLGDIVSS